jgi:hypothetical protein
MPGRSGVTVVTTLVCLFFYTRGCGRIARPAFPAPSDLWANVSSKTSGASRRENAELCVKFEPRHCEEPTGRANARPMTGSATKQSILPLRGPMDCFAEPVIGRRFAPTRWLAMTVSESAV